MRRAAGLVLALLAPLALTACNGGDEAEELSPEDRLAEAKTALDETSGVHLSLSADELRDGEEVLSTFSGTVPGNAVARVIPSAQADADFDATFTLDDGNQLDRVVMSGPFYPGTDPVTYTIELDQYGSDKDIQAP